MQNTKYTHRRRHIAQIYSPLKHNTPKITLIPRNPTRFWQWIWYADETLALSARTRTHTHTHREPATLRFLENVAHVWGKIYNIINVRCGAVEPHRLFGFELCFCSCCCWRRWGGGGVLSEASEVNRAWLGRCIFAVVSEIDEWNVAFST